MAEQRLIFPNTYHGDLECLRRIFEELQFSPADLWQVKGLKLPDLEQKCYFAFRIEDGERKTIEQYIPPTLLKVRLLPLREVLGRMTEIYRITRKLGGYIRNLSFPRELDISYPLPPWGAGRNRIFSICFWAVPPERACPETPLDKVNYIFGVWRPATMPIWIWKEQVLPLPAIKVRTPEGEVSAQAKTAFRTSDDDRYYIVTRTYWGRKGEVGVTEEWEFDGWKS